MDNAHAGFFAKHGRRRRIFCASLADIFDIAAPKEWRRDLFDLIELKPNLNWLLLTKRIGNVFDMVSRTRPHDWLAGRDNVWLGATVVNQAEADRDIPKLLDVSARIRFLSMEPLLGSVDSSSKPATPLRDGMPVAAICLYVGSIESSSAAKAGPRARPMHPAWAWTSATNARPPAWPSCSSNGASGHHCRQAR